MKRRARKQARELEAWELELIEKRQARLEELKSLDRLASSRSFKPRVIRRRNLAGDKLAGDMAKQASSSNDASKLDTQST